MVFNTLGDFDETVVASRRIRILGCYGFRGLRIVVGRAIGIGLAVRTLFPFDGIARDIARIVAESNRARFIGRCLIADGRAVGRGHDCLMTSGQSACCSRTSRAAGDTDRIVAIYSAIIGYIAMIIVFSS